MAAFSRKGHEVCLKYILLKKKKIFSFASFTVGLYFLQDALLKHVSFPSSLLKWSQNTFILEEFYPKG